MHTNRGSVTLGDTMFSVSTPERTREENSALEARIKQLVPGVDFVFAWENSYRLEVTVKKDALGQIRDLQIAVLQVVVNFFNTAAVAHHTR